MINEDYIKYSGEVTVRIMRRSEVLYEKVFHNKGRKPLFRHIANCLAGNYISAEEDRPVVLNIFSVPYSDTESGKNPESKASFDIKNYAKVDNLANSVVVTFIKKPELLYTKLSDVNYDKKSGVKYYFSVPFTSLTSFDGSNRGWSGYKIAPLNLVALYSKGNATNYTDPSAYFFITDISDNLTSLLPKEISSSIGDYSLTIEWKLTITNASTTVNN